MRQAMLTIAAAALAFALVPSPAAEAAVSLGFVEAAHEASPIAPGTIRRGDEYVAYAVKLKNTGTTKAGPGSNVTVSLPAGVEMSGGSGTSWVCHPAAFTCTSSSEPEPGAEFPKLKLEAWILPGAPETIAASFTAYGGGAGGDAFAGDSFTLGPPRTFGPSSLTAGACSAPVPPTVLVRSCKEAEEHGATPYTLAGGHPFAASSSFAFNQHTTPSGATAVVQSLRDLITDLPPGFIGNPQAAGRLCTVSDVRESTNTSVLCPQSAAVGGINAILPGASHESTPIYRVVPEAGYVAAFATKILDFGGKPTYVIRVKVRSNGDYGVTAIAPLTPQSPELLGVGFVTLCGYGAVASTSVPGTHIPTFTGCNYPATPGAFTVPFLTNPTRCAGGEPLTSITVDSYPNPGVLDADGFPLLSDPAWQLTSAASPAIGGCQALTEAWVGEGPEAAEPSLSFAPDTTQAAAPAGYTARLHIPQQGLLDPNGRATAHLKDTVVTLPRGVALNPSAAAGLGACSEAEAGYLGNDFPPPNPVHFSSASSGCPENSKIGTVVASTPLLDKPLKGAIYLAAQRQNPFGSDFAVYLVIDDPETGIKATLAGKVTPSEAEEGRITASFTDNPQVPLEDLTVSFFSGPRASLANPDLCGSYATGTDLTPWSAVDPDHPTAAEIAHSSDPVTIGGAPEGRSSCPASKADRPFDVDLSAGVADPTAGAHSPFTLRLTRRAGDQELSGVKVSTPPGFAASLRGVALCPSAGVARALLRTAVGDGAREVDDPSCPPQSQVGTTTIAAGAGTDPFYLRTGRVYLTGPYKGAPLSLTFVVPAVAGPFDLGVQVVRTALLVDPKTAAITAESDPLPQILDGVPLNVRDIRVDIDRPGFALNPTSCAPMAISGQISGGSGAVANLSRHFQVGNCGALGFHPDVKIQLHGGTKRGKYQRLIATVTYPDGPGYANIASASVALPHSEFLAQEHIRTVCTRVQFAAQQCPPGSIYGHAEAVTPLLDEPLTGNVYLRSSSNPLPDLVVALRGPDSKPIEVELASRTDSVHGGIRNTFDVLPDAPISRFTLSLMGGRKSLIVNSRDLCRGPKQRATVRLAAQNGLVDNFRTVVGNDCPKHPKHRRRG
jgi:hypothetical protein